jgi:hypothetical protein
MDKMKASGHPYTTKPISHLLHPKAMDERKASSTYIPPNQFPRDYYYYYYYFG